MQHYRSFTTVSLGVGCVLPFLLVWGGVLVRSAFGQIRWEGNGHYYLVVEEALSWEEARSRAESMTFMSVQGHLATITSEDENTFVTTQLGNFDGAWLGGEQLPDSEEPAGGWQWITGEPWEYTNWGPGEPNDAGGEDRLQYLGGPSWNDFPGDAGTGRFIVEWDIPTAVGGSVTGFRPLRIVCHNLTTGQSITVETSGSAAAWDCEALGLAVTEGDQVFTGAEGEVTPCRGRFRINPDGTVTDCETKLVWLREANCSALGVATWANATAAVAALNDGDCGLMDGSGEGDWRLPTPQEWARLVESAVALGLTNPALVNAAGNGQWSEGDAFRGVVSANYWSLQHSELTATVMRLSDGLLDEDLQIVHNFVWPVRAASNRTP